MAMTYASLNAQILNYANRTDAATIATVPTFIMLAEQRISRDLKSIGVENYVIGNFQAGEPTIAKPARWIRNISFNYGTGELNQTVNQLLLRTYEFLRDYSPNPSDVGPPQFYSDYGFSNFLIAPTPDLNYPFELCYMELPNPLTALNQTNWFSSYAPDALFYASMVECMSYLQNDSKTAYWKSFYQAAMDALNQQDNMRTLDRVTNREAD